MKSFNFFFFFFLFLMLLSVSVTAIRVSPPSFGHFDFESGESLTLKLSVYNNAGHPYGVSIGASGFYDSVVLSDNNFLLVPGVWQDITIDVTLKNYDDLTSFGPTKGCFSINEEPDPRYGGGAFTATTSIRICATFDVPIPGEFMELQDIIIPNPNEGENSTLELKMKNKGVLDIQDATATIRIADKNNETMTTLYFDDIDALAGEVVNVTQLLPSESWDSGMYYAYGELVYSPDKQPSKKDVNFFVGGVDVLLMDYTKNLTRGKINKVKFTLQSIFSEDLTNIRGSFKDFDGGDISLPVIDFTSFQSTTVDTYLDTPDINDSTFESVLHLEIPVPGKGIETKDLPLLFTLVDEKPVELPALPKKQISTTTKVMISLIVLILLIIILLFVWSIKKDKKDHNDKINKSKKGVEKSEENVNSSSIKNDESSSSKKSEVKQNEQTNKENKESFDWTE